MPGRTTGRDRGEVLGDPRAAATGDREVEEQSSLLGRQPTEASNGAEAGVQSNRRRRREGVCSLLRVPHYPNVFVAGLDEGSTAITPHPTTFCADPNGWQGMAV
jgi:hypothetical protein